MIRMRGGLFLGGNGHRLAFAAMCVHQSNESASSPTPVSHLGVQHTHWRPRRMRTAPDRTEADEYYFTYIDKVVAGDICQILEQQGAEVLRLFREISEERSRYRYAPDKWSIRQVAAHLNDCERLFVFRAMWFARGFDSTLPSFDQNVAMATAGADERGWTSHVDEFRSVRAATQAFFDNLPSEAWSRRGIASGNPFTVRALAYLTAGHVTHHANILRERYLK